MPALSGEMALDVESDSSTLDVQVQLDDVRAVRRLLGAAGGTVSATGADGSTFRLTIPPNALVGREEIVLTPVAAVSGLPEGVALAAGVQMAPEGLLLLEPATLTIEPPTPVPVEQEITLGWSGDGRGVHAQAPALQPRAATFQLAHFSAVAVGSGSAAAAESIAKKPALPCAGQYFGEMAGIIRRARQSALEGRGQTNEGESLTDAFIRISRRYLEQVLKPIVKQAETNDLLLPCAAAALYSWERQGQLLLGDTFEATFGADAVALKQGILQGIASSFGKSHERCMRNESPLYQLGRMIGGARQLALMSMGQLLPGDYLQKITSCARAFDYRVDVESEVENVYSEQAQGASIASSKTRIAATGVVAKFDDTQPADAPAFVASGVSPEATATIVPRNPCPDKVRVEPGSTIGMVIEPILNPRIGRLRCEGGKAKCDATDTNPGVLMSLTPHLVESTLVHTHSSKGCEPPGSWNEFMMYFTGRMSVGANEPFQVRGEKDAVTVVHHGTRKRRQYIDIPPALLQMNPGMKDYAEIDTPVIKTATERTRVTISVQRR